MENSARRAGKWPATRISCAVASALCQFAALSALSAEPLIMAEFPALPGGKSCKSAIVRHEDPPVLVTVVPAGANPLKPQTIAGVSPPVIRVIGHDPVSRLVFLEPRGDAPGGSPWLKSAGASIGTSLTAPAGNGAVDCRVSGWVKQVGGKILPFALLKVDIQGDVPSPGTPILDSQGRVVGLVFQGTGSGSEAYAIPAEAVHRVRRDICNGGVLSRGQVGFALNAQNPSPRIVRVLPGSPAAAVGIRPDDVLLQVGNRVIRTYADVPDALFHLIPGQATQVAVKRGSQRIDLTVTPARAR